MNKIRDFWPWPHLPIRSNQEKTFDWLEQNLDKKYFICEAPTGSGKSAIGITLSRYLSGSGQGDSFILTPQKILQEQYENTFDHSYLASLYGKSNYNCEKGNGLTCDIGGLLKPKCISCPHSAARSIARKSPNVVLNYKLALVSFEYTDNYAPRKLLVMDECHTLEDHLTDFTAVEISARRCERYNVDFKHATTIQHAIDWIEDRYLPAIVTKVRQLEYDVIDIEENSGSQLTSAQISKVREFKGLTDHWETVNCIVNAGIDHLEEKYVLVHDKNQIKFKPLTGGDNFTTILDRMGQQSLFMSSTIIDDQGFCNDLSIDKNKAAFLSLGSEFDPENRPVIFLPAANMNKDWATDQNKQGRDDMIHSIREIMNIHPKDSGIIHTGNYAIAKWLTEHLQSTETHDIYHHNPGFSFDRGTVIKGFQNTIRPAILISPSITEGLDLIDDLARFAIFAKVPFGFIGDQWIKARMTLSNEWYQRNAVIDIIQGGGRIVRSPTDWGTVYILDSGWARLFNTMKHYIPEWWLESYHG